jgi:hypothetical protein
LLDDLPAVEVDELLMLHARVTQLVKERQQRG